MYYLNAFNEMLRKRQRQNMMGGEGVGDAPPSGPMGASQSGGGMAGVRNALSNPFVSFAASMIPAARAPFALAKLGALAYDRFQANQNPYADDSMDRLSFNAPAYGQAGPEYGPPPVGNINPNAYDGEMAAAERMGGTTGYFSAGEPISMAPLVGAPLAPISTDVGSFYGGSDNNANTGNFGGVTGGADTMGFGGTYNQGGMVNAQHLMGRAPAPDDGYGALQGGEYVITKAAVEKYGKRLLDAINNGTFR